MRVLPSINGAISMVVEFSQVANKPPKWRPRIKLDGIKNVVA